MGQARRQNDGTARVGIGLSRQAAEPRRRVRQSGWREHFDDLKRLNVVAAEMEASVILVLARIWGLRAGGIAVVLDNVLRGSGDSGQIDPQEQFDHGGDEIERLARMGSEIVRIVAERDAASERAHAT